MRSRAGEGPDEVNRLKTSPEALRLLAEEFRIRQAKRCTCLSILTPHVFSYGCDTWKASIKKDVRALADRVIFIDYTNYRGIRRWRAVYPNSLKWVNDEYHTGWCIVGRDVERKEAPERSFYIDNIHNMEPA